METRGRPTLATAPQGGAHKRGKSASVLKSIMVSKNHKRSPSDGTPLVIDRNGQFDPRNAGRGLPLLPPDHPHNGQRVLGEIHNHSDSPVSPRKSRDVKEGKPLGLHKKTLSSVSLRSLVKEKDKEKEGKRSESPKKPMKTKSSTSLSRVFAKAKSKDSDGGNYRSVKDKENTTPPRSAGAVMSTPIWAEFSSTGFQEARTTTTIPLNDRQQVEEEIARYTPVLNYSPSKQRNFFQGGQPMLHAKPSKDRPKSEYIPNISGMSPLRSLTKRASNDHIPKLAAIPAHPPRPHNNSTTKRSFLRSSSPEKKKTKEEPKKGLTLAGRGTRVMAAVAALNNKSKEVEKEAKLDPKVVDAEFEAVLDSRNIPENMRPKMRSLTTTVKADFIKKNKLEALQSHNEPASKFTLWGENASKKAAGRPRNASSGSGKSASSNEDEPINSTKRSRPLSKTFTFSKGDSPTKKQRSDVGAPSTRSSKSIDLPKSPSMRSLVLASGPSSPTKSSRSAMPEEYVTYLRKVQKPQEVEVGRLQKLRQLLRNETVAWVDSFIKLGGMQEIVGLLHRIMEIEWREEHEDNLLHNALLCLKGLCTTGLALQELCSFAPTLFPALLAMLFDDEHKGPSEFTTRGLIITILFAHLSSAQPTDMPGRARAILSYLHDPIPAESARPLPFIQNMHTPRPYRIWCREVVNVTKEVFWIFLHHLNVVPMPSAADIEQDDEISYATIHFPGPRPPVPAAPYVGGVEWDATNYLASHLDLLNGIIASLPTVEERLALRQELKDSGWEKVMGSALRTCKEKFYGSVHDGLKTWVTAAVADGWDVKVVRMGEGSSGSPVKSPNKGGAKKVEKAPKLELPILSNLSKNDDEKNDDWL